VIVVSCHVVVVVSCPVVVFVSCPVVVVVSCPVVVVVSCPVVVVPPVPLVTELRVRSLTGSDTRVGCSRLNFLGRVEFRPKTCVPLSVE
jgi:hypothetical protein